MWRSSAVRHRRNAHDLYVAKVCYRHHPLYGVEVTVVRYLRRTSTAPVVIVRCPDGVQIAVPEWMLNATACDRLADQAQPLIGLSSLLTLRRLITEYAPATEKYFGAESSEGGKHARQGKLAHPTMAASVSPGPDLDCTAGECSSELSGSLRSVARGDVEGKRAEGE